MTVKAVCVLNGETVKGTLYFVQEADTHPVQVTGEVTGLAKGPHGFHIHEFGDNTNGCTSAGTTLQPVGQGARRVPTLLFVTLATWENIVAEDNGIAKVDISDKMIQLQGAHSIIGRTLVVHADPDDLGKGGHELSKTTGNAGARLACGVIGITKHD